MSGYKPPQCTEREPGGGWTDCLWCSLVMMANAAYASAHYPSTRTEYEALRRASGDLAGGSNMDDGVKGMDKRYGWHGRVTSNALFAIRALRVGETVALQGSMGRVSDHLRRWDPQFRGPHCATVTRDASGYWWQNPQAPQTYKGEYVAFTELERYAGGLAGARAMTIRIGQRKSLTYWGADLPAWLRNGYSSTSARSMFREAGINYGTVINMVDLKALFKHKGINYGTVINPIDMDALGVTKT